MNDLLGIYQADLIIQSAIVEGFRRLRNEDQWCLNYIFSSLPRDALTAKAYGQQDVESAKKWFLNTKIPTFINTRIDTFQGTCITIALQSSSEIENTLADTHYTPEEQIPGPPVKPLSPCFTPSYDPMTGICTINSDLNTDFFFDGMYVVNHKGVEYQIIDVLDEKRFKIAPQPVVDLTECALHPTPRGTVKVLMGSCAFRETFQIGVHESTDAYHCVVLHSIITFILLRYRKNLFEHRGLERTKFSSTDFLRDGSVDGEMVYQRYINLEAVVRHYWPVDDRNQIAQGVTGALRVIGLPNMPDDSPPATQLWIGEDDVVPPLGSDSE